MGRARRPAGGLAERADVSVPAPAAPARSRRLGAARLDLTPLILIVLIQLVLMLPVRWLEQSVATLLR